MQTQKQDKSEKTKQNWLESGLTAAKVIMLSLCFVT